MKGNVVLFVRITLLERILFKKKMPTGPIRFFPLEIHSHKMIAESVI